MRTTTITVSSQRKVPHPAIDFANFSELVSLTAEISEEENVAVCTQKLQQQAENLVEKRVEQTTARLTPKPRDTAAERMQAGTANTAAKLAEKHGVK